MGPWMLTQSGRRVDLANPRAEQIDLEDIAVALARINRFTGHTTSPYTVAQHSVLVSKLCRRNPLAGLLHDAHEAYTGDISRPLREAMPYVRQELAEIQARLDEVIAAKFGVDLAAFHSEEVRQADNVLLATERRDLLVPHDHRHWSAPLPAEMAQRIEPLATWVQAKTQFLARFAELKERG